MAGAYCQFCGRRCFVERKLPGDARRHAGQTLHMATCLAGQKHDLKVTGYTYDTARPELVGAVQQTVVLTRGIGFLDGERVPCVQLLVSSPHSTLSTSIVMTEEAFRAAAEDLS